MSLLVHLENIHLNRPSGYGNLIPGASKPWRELFYPLMAIPPSPNMAHGPCSVIELSRGPRVKAEIEMKYWCPRFFPAPRSLTGKSYSAALNLWETRSERCNTIFHLDARYISQSILSPLSRPEDVLGKYPDTQKPLLTYTVTWFGRYMLAQDYSKTEERRDRG